MNNQTYEMSAAQSGVFVQRPTPEPQPTDMQTHVQRAHEVTNRLEHIHTSLTDLLSRLYGSGEATALKAVEPQAAGLTHEMTGALSDIEAVAERLFHATSRLGSFA